MSDDELVTTAEVARRLGLAPSSVWKALARLELTAVTRQPGRDGQDLWSWTAVQERWNDPARRPGRGRTK